MMIFRKPSLSMRFTSFLAGMQRMNFKAGKVDRLWEKIKKRGKAKHAQPPIWLRMKHQIIKDTIKGQDVFTVSNGRPASDYHIIYIHGGGYISPMHPAHWLIIGSLLKYTKANITVPTYPLTPEHNYRDAVEHLETVYLNTVAMYPEKKIVLCGDSAGGGLALALTFNCREKSLHMPEQLILFAPWLDATLADPDASKIEDDDIMLGVDGLRKAGLMWAAGDDPQNPLVSPLYANLRDLPPTTIFQGTADVFICDARTFYQKAIKEHAPLQLFEYEGAFHVYMFSLITPEAQDTYRRIAQLLN